MLTQQQKSGRSTTTCTHTLPRNCLNWYPVSSQWMERDEVSQVTAWEATAPSSAISRTPACSPLSPRSLQSATPPWCLGERRPSPDTWALLRQGKLMTPLSWLPTMMDLRYLSSSTRAQPTGSLTIS